MLILEIHFLIDMKHIPLNRQKLNVFYVLMYYLMQYYLSMLLTKKKKKNTMSYSILCVFFFYIHNILLPTCQKIDRANPITAILSFCNLIFFNLTIFSASLKKTLMDLRISRSKTT